VKPLHRGRKHHCFSLASLLERPGKEPTLNFGLLSATILGL
jgi:hypothetical protein